MMQLRRRPQTPQEQWGESLVFTLLGAIRIVLWFAAALEGLKSELGRGFAHFAAHFAAGLRTPLVVIFLLVVLLLYGHLLRGKRIAPWILDGLGLWAIFNLFMHFAKINLLMLTDAIEPSLLLGQIITYLLFFFSVGVGSFGVLIG